MSDEKCVCADADNLGIEWCLNCAKSTDAHDPWIQFCTRERGHAGEHVSCARPDKHRIHHWPNKETNDGA